MIEFHLLRYAVAAADTGSFSRAAEQFNIKQSTLSKQVQYLELRIGLPIFRRSTRGVTPTDPGEHFLMRARRILHDVEALGKESRAFARGEIGALRIGFHASLASGDLSATIRAYRSTFPNVEIAARECDRTDLLTLLDRGTLDVAVMAGCQSRDGIRSLRLWNEPILIALEPDHPMARREPLCWTDLRDAAFLVTAADPGPDIASMITARLSMPGHRPGIIIQEVSRENLLSFVGGEKVAAIAGCAPLLTADSSGLLYREVRDGLSPACLDQSVHWRPDNRNVALSQFLDLLSRRCGRAIANHRERDWRS